MHKVASEMTEICRLVLAANITQRWTVGWLVGHLVGFGKTLVQSSLMHPHIHIKNEVNISCLKRTPVNHVCCAGKRVQCV